MERIHRGTVVDYDDPRGIGTVRSTQRLDHSGQGHPSDGPFRFHCVSITDGSRAIEVGRAVAFTVRPGHRGHWEAIEVTPL